MDIEQAYDSWANQYDSNKNKTRDLEAIALRQTLKKINPDSCLEIGCGTGKNTQWLAKKTDNLMAVDFSTEMLRQAKQKLAGQNVQFVQADITQDWDFSKTPVSLVSFSLILEHIKELEPIFHKSAAALKPGGMLYIGELHPYKQYLGSKARFDTAEGRQVLTCFPHHVSDYLEAADKAGLELALLKEFFDEDKKGIPRILSILFRKP